MIPLAPQVPPPLSCAASGSMGVLADRHLLQPTHKCATVLMLSETAWNIAEPLSLRAGSGASHSRVPRLSRPPVALRAFLRAYSRRIVGDSTTGCGDSRYRGNALGSAEVAKLEPLGERLAGYAAPKGSV